MNNLINTIESEIKTLETKIQYLRTVQTNYIKLNISSSKAGINIHNLEKFTLKDKIYAYLKSHPQVTCRELAEGIEEEYSKVYYYLTHKRIFKRQFNTWSLL